jgi:glycerate dehydrogenase
MRIVLLDAEPITGSSRADGGEPSSVALARFAALGQLEIHELTLPEEVLPRLRGAEIALTNKVVLGMEELRTLPDLRLISVLATGVNVIDLLAAKQFGVTVCNVPGYSTASVAQHAIALLLELSNHVGRHAADVAEGGWEASPVFSYYLEPLLELEGSTLGIVGYGAIGRRVAKIAQALGMRVIVHTRSAHSGGAHAGDDVEFVDKPSLLARSDAISLHVPLSPETRNFLNAAAFADMKRSALVINCSRGSVIDERALLDALRSGRIRGAALDVLEAEPPPRDHPLLRLSNCLVTPHIAWASRAARERLLGVTADNVRAFLDGQPQNVVG